MQITKMPAPWKRAEKKGSWYRPIEGGNLVFDTIGEKFGVEIARGSSDETDVWGRWRGVLEDEETILTHVAEWMRKLAKSGWTSMVYSTEYGVHGTQMKNEAAMVKALGRLPRGETIPTSLLKLLDSSRAKAGKSVAGGVLRIAGHDVHVEEQGGWDLVFQNIVTFQTAGAAKQDDAGVSLDLDVHSIDALIDRLVEVRTGMVTFDEYRARTATMANPVEGENPKQRIERVRERMALTRDIQDELAASTDEQLKTVLMMVQMLKAGDMTVDFIHGDGMDVEGNLH